MSLGEPMKKRANPRRRARAVSIQMEEPAAVSDTLRYYADYYRGLAEDAADGVFALPGWRTVDFTRLANQLDAAADHTAPIGKRRNAVASRRNPSITKASAVAFGEQVAARVARGEISDARAQQLIAELAASVADSRTRRREMLEAYERAVFAAPRRNPRKRKRAAASRRSVRPGTSKRSMRTRARRNPAASRETMKTYRARYKNGAEGLFKAQSDASAMRYAQGLGAHRAGCECVSLREVTAGPKKKKSARRVNPDNRDVDRAVKALEDFTGHEVKRLERYELPNGRAGFALGPVPEMHYIATRDGETAHYVHKFAARSRPLLVASDDGANLYLLGGAFRVTDRGIVDSRK